MENIQNLTVRDRFAIAAMTAIMNSTEIMDRIDKRSITNSEMLEEIAIASYKMANAMIKQKKNFNHYSKP